MLTPDHCTIVTYLIRGCKMCFLYYTYSKCIKFEKINKGHTVGVIMVTLNALRPRRLIDTLRLSSHVSRNKMGDSDDEGRGERRSKFARERSDSERGMMKRSGRYHDDYHEGGRREKRRPPSPTFSRGGRADSPPLYGHGSKRMKREHWLG